MVLVPVLACLCALALGAAQAPPAPASVSALDFGAKGDGVADDTAAIQKALDAVAGTRGVVHLPAGSYRLSGTLHVQDYTTLMGEVARWESGAVRLVVPSPGFAAVRLHHGAGLKAVQISYPNNTHN